MELMILKKSISDNIKIIDLTITAISIITCIFIYMLINNEFIKYIAIVILAIVAIISMIRVIGSQSREVMQVEIMDTTSNINNICLLNEENEIITEWELMNKTSLVVGRNTKKNEVDIDLSTSTYASLIDPQHAVLNFAAGSWYIEDLYSENGISIQKVEDSIRYRLSKDKPCTISKGDIVFMAKTKLLIR